MSEDVEVLLIKIERQIGRICKALDEKSKGGANELYLIEQFSNYLDRHFPSWKDNLAAQEWFDRVVGGHDIMDVKVDCVGSDDFVEIVPVPIKAARNIFTVGWMEAMKSVRNKVQS